jgi:uncharacterized phage-associated protein
LVPVPTIHRVRAYTVIDDENYVPHSEFSVFLLRIFNKLLSRIVCGIILDELILGSHYELTFLIKSQNEVRMVNTKSVVQTICYILQNTGPIDKLKIVKMVYFADKLHLQLYGRTITGDSYCVMKNGPVGSTTLDVLNENLEYLDENDIEYSKGYLRKLSSDSKFYEASNAQNELDYLAKSDKKVLDQIIQKFSKIDSLELVEITHKYPEWKQYEEDFNNQTRKHADIRTEELFSQIENDPLGVDPEHAKLTKELYLGLE